MSLESLISLLLHTHPNQATSFQLNQLPPNVPDKLIQHIRAQSLDRTPVPLSSPNQNLKGIPAKKLHEITRLSSYIHSLHQTGLKTPYIVDIGAGQGFLTRVLPAKKILALDSDGHLTENANSYSQVSPSSRNTTTATTTNIYDAQVTHRTLHITPESLIGAIDDWIRGDGEGEGEVPVMLVALHACGSLSIDALRAFTSTTKAPSRNWYPSSVITIPCCYNLLRPTDFPLSSPNPRHLAEALLPNPLPPSAYHLAAQVSNTPLTPDEKRKHELSTKKVVWRALLGPLLPPTTLHTRGFIAPSESYAETQNATSRPPARQNLHTQILTIASPTNPNAWGADALADELGNSPMHHRIGKLPASAYVSWETFVRAAGEKLGVPLGRSDTSSSEHGNDTQTAYDTHRATQLETLHLLRCQLGPVIESVILRDRVDWIVGCLGSSASVSGDANTNSGASGGEDVGNAKWTVALIPLFDQTKGSGRNMALVVLSAP
ncbi:hypothetical protein Moror_3123 [Moniliophthora roreri MCA 2997]|uniref:Methyltransferase domain-containing protein n=2 Tax=Moniliophthora roreri TaxID=221103 RepID=V2X468_MONRO|nr:hypothetical protein Moror_3123 [Moniliophthora roreri MCA 2997]